MFVTCYRPQQLPLSYLPLPYCFQLSFLGSRPHHLNTPTQKCLLRAHTVLVHCGRPEQTTPACTLLCSLCIYFQTIPTKATFSPTPLSTDTGLKRNAGEWIVPIPAPVNVTLFVTYGYLAKVTMRNEFLTKEGLSPLWLVSLRREDRRQCHVEKQTQEGGHKTRTHRLECRS